MSKLSQLKCSYMIWSARKIKLEENVKGKLNFICLTNKAFDDDEKGNASEKTFLLPRMCSSLTSPLLEQQTYDNDSKFL